MFLLMAHQGDWSCWGKVEDQLYPFGEGRRYGSKPDFYGHLFAWQFVGNGPKFFGGQTCQRRHFPIKEFMIMNGIIN